MAAGQHATGEKGGILRSFVSLLIMIAFVLGLSWALRTCVPTAYEIPSGSMEETIMTGDMVFAEKVSYYFRDPQPGDIVTFADPEIPGRTLIKRCIATAGQTIDIDGDGFPISTAWLKPKPTPTTSPRCRLPIPTSLSRTPFHPGASG